MAAEATHWWRVVCRKPGLTVDEQISRIVDRLLPHATRIGALGTELDEAEGGRGSSIGVERQLADVCVLLATPSRGH